MKNLDNHLFLNKKHELIITADIINRSAEIFNDSVHSILKYEKENNICGYFTTNKIRDEINLLINIFTNLQTVMKYSSLNFKKETVSKANSILQFLKDTENFVVSHLAENGYTAKGRFTIQYKKLSYRIESEFLKVKKLALKITSTDKFAGPFTKYTWPEKSVFIGSMRNTNQLKINLKYNFYHVPLKYMGKPDKVKIISLYQSKKLFDTDSGIKYYGNVSGFEILKRREIKEIPSNSDEIYCKFSISKWNILKTPIKSDCPGQNFLYTNPYLFFESETLSRLHLTSYEENRIFNFMTDYAFSSRKSIIYSDNFYMEYNGNGFSVYKGSQKIKYINNDNFLKKGTLFIKEIFTS